ncbi:hypothetical protein DNTS_012232 [Danionella cerebrum]|uniref:Uncharacterized protein n=1 Tax=Danionella cerebrum TaxID=2873325 RepID=A0A553N282_9TELE|nr:hypothetical protein DNTS_012232 [Danionella translucida]
MTQEIHLILNQQEWGEITPDTFQSCPFSINTPYGYQLDLDFVKYVDDIEQSDTIRRLHFTKRSGVANAAPVPQHTTNHTPWTSSESLSPVSSDEAKKVSPATSLNSVNSRRPPLPHSKHKSTIQRPEFSEDQNLSEKPTSATQQTTLTKSNPAVEKTLTETCKRLEHEKGSLQHGAPEPLPRRRLSSFGGLGSSGSLSPYTSWNALNHNAKMAVLGQHKERSLSLGSGIKISPSSSGRASPVGGVSPLHLQMVRDQMATALRRLQDLEEQVKAIPKLQLKISVLQEEKRQLTTLVKNQDQKSGSCIDQKQAEDNEHSSISGLTDFQQLSVEMQLLERKIQDACLETSTCKSRSNLKSIAVDNDWSIDANSETLSIGVSVTETMLGELPDKEEENQSQQQIIQDLNEQVQKLESDLKEAMLAAEMGRLRSELREAEARNHSDKSSTAKPRVQCTATQTNGFENHTILVHSSIGDGLQGISIADGDSRKPEVKAVSSGPDLPMEEWEIRKRVERKDQCVGRDCTDTCSQGVGTTLYMCDAATITSEATQNRRNPSIRTLACENSTVSLGVGPDKCLISQGTVTNQIRTFDLGVMATPQTLSQRTSTSFSTISRSTSTVQASNSEASTNTKHMLTRERHTNTPNAFTRSLAVGDGKVCDLVATVQMRSVGTTALSSTSTIPKVITRDVGIGMANINENVLIGLQTRNIACGPTCLPDPAKTRSIGIEVGDGRIRDTEGQMFVQSEPGLDHYIDRMQKLLKEQQDLLTDGNPVSNPELTLQSGQQLQDSERSLISHDTSGIQPMELQMSKALHGDDRCKRIMKRKSSKPKSPESINTTTASVVYNLVPFSESVVPKAEDKKRVGKRDKEWGTNDKVKNPRRKERYRFSEKIRSACQTLEVHLSGCRPVSNRELVSYRLCRNRDLGSKSTSSGKILSFVDEGKRSCLSSIQQEWFCLSSQKKACPQMVEDFLSACCQISPDVLCYVANMADQNGNTALHYSVSHSNFSVVKVLLAAGVCNIGHQNKAGYTSIMLASLAAVENKEDMKVVEELFSRGDVNAKASQAGQTALMLAVSHGRVEMVHALLAAGAEVNIQDDEGSTALMCAGEHGHADIIKLLLAQTSCDATLTDNDESTALSIALEAGHKDIAMLLYAHINYSRGQTKGSPRSKTPPN